ncbi:hypothetical protein LUZ62_026931 [Rhynchospora pubera]|uniref:Nucleolus and neural progenitor protein-like N-terminal domain-containing protein n=1 Tax=Rhynchospora pubera TaxID=906938 RepID=A0AAV8HEQ7_9POAL|nr:hypothetical protein LUZ62_090841 [Rhynchospora pubera]KAJ4814365.1 hypothetical protein LUZ62_026931 [Rhynchospora pubera]
MGEEERLRSLITKLQVESSVLDRVVYKNKNQHRRSRYFQYLLKVRRDLKLLEAAKLPLILNALFPIIDGKRPAEKAHLPYRGKKQFTGAKYSYHERLLGVARLLSEMSEPVINAAIQISLLLAKSFFVGFSTMVLALLGRIRVIVQQTLLDVVTIFNKVSEISQRKQSVKLTEDVIKVFREYNPVKNEVVILECKWKEDKFVLLEKSQNKNNSVENGDAIPCESTIQYSTILLFDEDKLAESQAESSHATPLDNISSGDQIDGMNLESNVSAASAQIKYEDTLKQQEKGKHVAFVSVGKPRIIPSDPDLTGSNKKPKLDLDAAGSGLPGNPFDDLDFSVNRESSIF